MIILINKIKTIKKTKKKNIKMRKLIKSKCVNHGVNACVNVVYIIHVFIICFQTFKIIKLISAHEFIIAYKTEIKKTFKN